MQENSLVTPVIGMLTFDLTAGVVLFTLLVQGTTIGRLIRVLEPR
jgi:hypothetical protein